MYTLHRFRYSPYARKVQRLLELLALPHRVVEAPYGDREELATLTGGWIQVPVLQTPEGEVWVESREICRRLLTRHPGPLLPEPLEAAVWALHDQVEGPVEDVLFRLATPAIRDAWPTAWERALYTFVKERRFGAGCVDTWRRDRAALLGRAREVLTPLSHTLARQPFLLGGQPTFADLALYGQWVMLEEAEAGLLAELGPEAVAHKARVEALAPAG